MLNFAEFLTEAANEEKLTHLEHAEDHPINAGTEGYAHAENTLHAVHKALKGEKSAASISTKYDGSPSVVFGHHPETGKFFVASKSAFNKNPKLNYTHADIEKNHGHAPGLVSKLKHALTHLPKVTPAKGVYQGDFMYSKHDGDVTEDKGHYHFKPNTITYSAKKDSEEGQKIKAAKIGVVVHTRYEGKTLDNMKAKYNTGSQGFSQHKDVHIVDPHFDTKTSHYPPEAQKQFETHMNAAAKAHSKLKDYAHLEGHQDHIKTYINSTFKGDKATTPNVADYREHVRAKMQSTIETLKTDKTKNKRLGELHDTISHIDTHSEKFANTFKLHQHLQAAKNTLVHTLSGANYAFHHSIKGEKAKPEGHVAVINNRPTKLVDRNEFSRANFNTQDSKKSK